MAYISIQYTGGDTFDDDDNLIEGQILYESVEISSGEDKFVFNSGNFVKDWYDAKKKYILDLQDKDPIFSQSSTVNHFIMDGSKFDSAYMHGGDADDDPVLKYLDRTDPKWYLSKNGDGWEFFVVEGTTPTWKELKDLCGDIKK